MNEIFKHDDQFDQLCKREIIKDRKFLQSIFLLQHGHSDHQIIQFRTNIRDEKITAFPTNNTQGF